MIQGLSMTSDLESVQPGPQEMGEDFRVSFHGDGCPAAHVLVQFILGIRRVCETV